MAFCPNCGNQIEEGSAFCGACGTSVATNAAQPAAPVQPAAPAWSAPAQSAPAWSAPQAPTYTAPTYAAPTYTTPGYRAPVQEEISGGTRAKGIIGMIASIFGMILAIIGLIGTLTFLGTWWSEPGFEYALIMMIFSLPLSIVGRVLSSSSQDAGNDSGVCGAGKAMGLVGIILTAVMMFFGFICLA